MLIRAHGQPYVNSKLQMVVTCFPYQIDTVLF